MRLTWLPALLGLILTPGTVAAQEDAPLTRGSQNPLLTHGPPGSIDQLKLGPRAMLRLAPSDWRMWYEAVPAGNKSYAAYATSSDGLTWTRYAGNPVLSPAAAWEGGAGNPEGETSPTSVLKEHGLFSLWYHGFSGGTRQIGHATSPDGITWTKFSGNPIVSPGPSGAWDADSVCEPNVVHVGSVYYMYYSHCTGTGGIGLATSADGVTWTKYSGNPVIATGTGWDSAQVDWGGVYHDGQRFHMWYLGHAGVGGFSLGYASSADGKTFTKSAANPVLAPPSPLIISTDYAVNKGDGIGIENSAKMFRFGSSWWFYYGGFASCCPEDATLCFATAPVRGSPNRAPQVDAGADQTITLPGVAGLAGTVMDDDVPVLLGQVKSRWSKVSGPGSVAFAAPDKLSTTASFSAPGTYVLRMTADDTALSSFADVTISVRPSGADAGAGGGDAAVSRDADVAPEASPGGDASGNAPPPTGSRGCSCRIVTSDANDPTSRALAGLGLGVFVARRGARASGTRRRREPSYGGKSSR